MSIPARWTTETSPFAQAGPLASLTEHPHEPGWWLLRHWNEDADLPTLFPDPQRRRATGHADGLHLHYQPGRWFDPFPSLRRLGARMRESDGSVPHHAGCGRGAYVLLPLTPRNVGDVLALLRGHEFALDGRAVALLRTAWEARA